MSRPLRFFIMQTIMQNLNAETVEGRVMYLAAGSRVVPVDPSEVSPLPPPPGAGFFLLLPDWIRHADPVVDALVVPLSYVTGEGAP